jgi:hypothetical protein
MFVRRNETAGREDMKVENNKRIQSAQAFLEQLDASQSQLHDHLTTNDAHARSKVDVDVPKFAHLDVGRCWMLV